MIDDDNRDVAERNYQAFAERLPELLATSRDRFALLRQGQIVSIHDALHEAWEAGARQYPDRRFSVQEITDVAADQGCYSHVVAHVFL